MNNSINKGITTCTRCNGAGQFTWANRTTGEPTTGTCFRCEGHGTQKLIAVTKALGTIAHLRTQTDDRRVRGFLAVMADVIIDSDTLADIEYAITLAKQAVIAQAVAVVAAQASEPQQLQMVL